MFKFKNIIQILIKLLKLFICSNSIFRIHRIKKIRYFTIGIINEIASLYPEIIIAGFRIKQKQVLIQKMDEIVIFQQEFFKNNYFKHRVKKFNVLESHCPFGIICKRK